MFALLVIWVTSGGLTFARSAQGVCVVSVWLFWEPMDTHHLTWTRTWSWTLHSYAWRWLPDLVGWAGDKNNYLISILHPSQPVLLCASVAPFIATCLSPPFPSIPFLLLPLTRWLVVAYSVFFIETKWVEKGENRKKGTMGHRTRQSRRGEGKAKESWKRSRGKKRKVMSLSFFARLTGNYIVRVLSFSLAHILSSIYLRWWCHDEG